MKQKKHPAALLLTAVTAAVLLTSVPARAASYWVPTKTVYYDYADGKWTKTLEFYDTYNKKGQNTADKTIIYSSYFDSVKQKNVTQKVTNETKWTFNKNGTTKKTSNYTDGELQTTITFSYNKSGSITKAVTKNAAGKTVRTTAYTYNKKGAAKGLTAKVVTTESDGTKDTTVCTYTIKNKVVRKKVEKSGDQTSTYEYSAKGDLTRFSYVMSSGYLYISNYDTKGNLLTDKTTSLTGSVSSSTYTYKNGRLTKKTVVDAEKLDSGKTKKETTTYTYKYKTDKSGRLTQQTEYKNSKLNQKITYSGFQKIPG